MYNGTNSEEMNGELALKMGLLSNHQQSNMVHPFQQQMHAALGSFPNGNNGNEMASNAGANSNNNPNLASLSQHYLRLLMMSELFRQQQGNQQDNHISPQQLLPQFGAPAPQANPNALAAAALFAQCLSSASSTTSSPASLLQNLNVDTRGMDDSHDRSSMMDSRSPTFSMLDQRGHSNSMLDQRGRSNGHSNGRSNGFTHHSM